MQKYIIKIMIMLFLLIITPVIILKIGIADEYKNIILTYVGAIYGGLLTLVGVIVTIQNENNQKRKELQLLYKPILGLEILNNFDNKNGEVRELIVNYHNNSYKDSDFTYGDKCLKISNIGRGEAKNLNIKSEKIEVINSNSNIIEPSFYILSSFSIKMLPVDNQFYIIIGIPKVIEGNSNIKDMLKINAIITMEDLFENNEYKYKLEFCLLVNNIMQDGNIKYKYDIYSTRLYEIN